MPNMAMGRKRPKQADLWIPHGAAAKPPSHTFYEALNRLLAEADFDRFVEAACAQFYRSDSVQGRKSFPPGLYFRMLLVGFFEGIESERGICWRFADSLSLRSFVGLGLGDPVPDHSTLSRTRSRLSGEVYDQVFQFMLGLVEKYGLLRGRVAGVDSTYLRADASMKAIVRRDTGEQYAEYLDKLARAEGMENPTAEDARRLDRKRKKKTSNAEWESKTDPDARIARIKDGRTRLAYKAEHVVDLETGAIMAAVVHPADAADTRTIVETLDATTDNMVAVMEAAVEAARGDDDQDQPPAGGKGPSASCDEKETQPLEVVADKGYHSAPVLRSLEERDCRTYVPERKQKASRRWAEKENGAALRRAFHNNRKRSRGEKAKALHRARGELLERTFAHICETGGARRTRLRGRANVAKRYVIQAAAANLGLLIRTLLRCGTPRGLANAGQKIRKAFLAFAAT